GSRRTARCRRLARGILALGVLVSVRLLLFGIGFGSGLVGLFGASAFLRLVLIDLDRLLGALPDLAFTDLGGFFLELFAFGAFVVAATTTQRKAHSPNGDQQHQDGAGDHHQLTSVEPGSRFSWGNRFILGLLRRRRWCRKQGLILIEPASQTGQAGGRPQSERIIVVARH